MIDSHERQRVQENWRRVEEEVHQAAESAGRDGDSVRIIGVSKYVGEDLTAALVDAGCQNLGESRPQSLWQKAKAIVVSPDFRWHLIGHLQRNKVRRTLGCNPVIHSIDSERLLRAVADQSMSLGQSTSVLLEVNISGDGAKTGLAEDDLADLIRRTPDRGVQIVGLMAMAGRGADSETALGQFQRTRDLRDRLREQTGQALPELSMGMSGDFAEAIQAGATMVRVGSRLFEGVNAE